jgi:hypothetical protein
MDRARLIANIQGRMEQCRRLAAATTDVRTAKILRDMAAEGEDDVRRLLAEISEANATGESPARTSADQP